MEQANKKKYESPHLTVVEFKTEMGFAASGGVTAASGSVTATRRGYDNDGSSSNNQSWF